MLEIIKTALEDIQAVFGINKNLFELYFVNEISKNKDLVNLINKRQNNFDWQKETKLGGAGTVLNGTVLYCLIREFDMLDVLETGVSGGLYTSFMLAALDANCWDGAAHLVSLELSDDMTQVGKLIPENIKKKFHQPGDWNLIIGKSSLDYFKALSDGGMHHGAQLYSHDSLHTYEHMMEELRNFKESHAKKFFVFIDDEKSDDFWNRCIADKSFDKDGYSVKFISGKESRLNGHLGGFLMYEKN